MSVQHETAPDSGDNGWHKALTAAIARVQRKFDAANGLTPNFDAMLDGYVELSCADIGMLAEMIGDTDTDARSAVARCVRARGAEQTAVTVGDTRMDVMQALMRRASRSARPCSRRIPGPGGATHSVLAVPVAANGRVLAVVGLSSDTSRLEAQLGSTLEPYTLTCAACIRESRIVRRHARDKRQLRDSERTMRAVLDNIVDAIVTVDHRGHVETANAAAEHIFGYTPDELVGSGVGKLVAAPDDGDPNGEVSAFLAGDSGEDRGRGRELQGRRKDGTVFPMSLATSEIEVSGRRLFVAIARDNTEHQENQLLVERERAANQTLELLIRIDGLTGIANRRHFDEAIEEEGRRAARNGQPLSLIICDVDCFKAFNDRYGHVAGDKALTSVAREIDAAFHRAGDSAARYGGEEFAVILPATAHEQALALAETVRLRIWQLSIPHGASAVADRVTISAGVATCHPDRHFDAASLVELADRALYRAKQGGRNRALG